MRRFALASGAIPGVVLLFVVLPLSVTAPAAATLVGDPIHGEIQFPPTGTDNLFDPVFGHVPSPSSGIQPLAVVTEADTLFAEFEYTDGPPGRVNIELDVDATTIHIREFLIDALQPAIGVQPWEIWLTDLDFGGPGGVVSGASIVSTNFTGLDVSAVSDHEIHLSYAGGQDIATPADELVATIQIVPEPATAWLVALGLLALGLRERRRRS